jgi:glycosyltransferase involved in cell wall biosynthesis
VSDEFPSTVHQLPIYSRAHLDWSQRLRLFALRSRRNDYDVIHYLFTPTFLNSALFRRLLGGGRAKSIQTMASLNGRQYTRSQLDRIAFADAIITYSDFSRRTLEDFGFSNVETIQPGIDLARFTRLPRNGAMAGELGLQPTDFVAMYPGEYVRLGATDSLVAILPELVERIPNFKLVFGCRIKNQADADKKREVVATLTAAGLLDRVVFTDTIRDMPSLYNLADVVLFPVENMVGKFDVPLAVIEAMACERPVIVSNLPVLAEFTSDETTVTVAPGDRDGLVEAVVALEKDAKRRTSLGRKARAYTEKWFDIDRIAARYEAVYERLANGS